MPGQKIEKKGEVAAIGGDRVRRGAALAAEPGHPQQDRGAQILGGGKPRQRHRLGKRGENARGRFAQTETLPNWFPAKAGTRRSAAGAVGYMDPGLRRERAKTLGGRVW